MVVVKDTMDVAENHNNIMGKTLCDQKFKKSWHLFTLCCARSSNLMVLGHQWEHNLVDVKDHMVMAMAKDHMVVVKDTMDVAENHNNIMGKTLCDQKFKKSWHLFTLCCARSSNLMVLGHQWEHNLVDVKDHMAMAKEHVAKDCGVANNP